MTYGQRSGREDLDAPIDHRRGAADRAGAGPTAGAGGIGARAGLPFLDVQMASDDTIGSLLDPLALARTGTLETAVSFFRTASLADRHELLEARRSTRDRLALLRVLPDEELIQVLHQLPANAQAVLLGGDGLDDRLAPAEIARILNVVPLRDRAGQPRLTLAQMIEVFPRLEGPRQATLLVANPQHGTPILNSLDDHDLDQLLHELLRHGDSARALVDDVPGHLRDRIRAAAGRDPALAALAPTDTSGDADLVASQTDPSRAWLWESQHDDHGMKHLPSPDDWARMPVHIRMALFVAATVPRRVSYLQIEPDSKAQLLRHLPGQAKVDTLLAFVARHPQARALLAQLTIDELLPAMDEAPPASAATLFLASNPGEQQALGAVMSPMQVAAILRSADLATAWPRVWATVPESLIAAALRRLEPDQVEDVMAAAGDSAARLRALLD